MTDRLRFFPRTYSSSVIRHSSFGSRRFGFHISIAGGIDKVPQRAHEKGANTVQLFTRNPRGWRSPELAPRTVAGFRAGVEEYDIAPRVVHAMYLVNLASPDLELFRKSVEVVAEDLRRADALSAEYVVTHLGSAGAESKAAGIRRAIKGVKRALSQAPGSAALLLENSAGAGNIVGSTFEELAAIIDGAGGGSRLGTCFDTAHCFQSGRDISDPDELEAILSDLDRHLGFGRLRVIHLNDSKTPLGSNWDRHQHIGRGYIGKPAMGRIINHPLLRHLPMIMETPINEEGDDEMNLATVKRMTECQNDK